MPEKTRIFGGEKYTYHGSFSSRARAMSKLLNTVTLSRVKWRIVKRVSRAPPQGDVWYELYYRYVEHKNKRGK